MRQGKRLGLQLGVELEDFRLVVQRRLLVRAFGVDAQITGRPVLGHITGVDFPLRAELHQIMRPGSGAERAVVRVDASNAGDDEVSLAQVELRRQGQRQGRCSSVGLAHAGDQQADVLIIAANGRVLGGKTGHLDLLGQVQPVNPVLCFGRKHGDQHDLGCDRCNWRGSRPDSRAEHCQRGAEGVASGVFHENSCRHNKVQNW